MFQINYRKFVLGITILFLTTLARSGPPYLTDDPEPVEYQHWEFYVASLFTHDAGGWSGTAPHFEINYGAIPNLQLHVLTPFYYVSPNQESSHYGYGDTELGIKYRFIQETDHHPQIGIFPLIEIPTGNSNEGLGTGHTQVFLPIWLQKSIGPWSTYGGGGYWINPGEGNRNWGFVGWQFQYQLTKNFAPGLELFHQTAQTEDGKSETGFNIGMVLDLNDNNHILFSAGHSIFGANTFQEYLAYQLTFGPKEKTDSKETEK